MIVFDEEINEQQARDPFVGIFSQQLIPALLAVLNASSESNLQIAHLWKSLFRANQMQKTSRFVRPPFNYFQWI